MCETVSWGNWEIDHEINVQVKERQRSPESWTLTKQVNENVCLNVAQLFQLIK